MPTSTQRVRITGKVGAVAAADCAFTLILQSGDEIRVAFSLGHAEVVASLIGCIAIVDGIAHFQGSDSLVWVDATHVHSGSDEDVALWSEMPRPVFAMMDLRLLRRAQSPRTGINAIIGAWPGDETDGEIFAQIEEMS